MKILPNVIQINVQHNSETVQDFRIHSKISFNLSLKIIGIFKLLKGVLRPF